MIKNLSIFIGSLLFITVINLNNLSRSVVLNRDSLDLVKNPENSLINNHIISEDDCHFFWFSFIDDYLNQKDYHDNPHLSSIMRCSKLHLDMLYAFFPKDIEISQKVNEFYPDNIEFMYWLLDSSESDFEKSKNILYRIIELDDKDAVAWRRLGYILWKNTEYEKGLQAYLNACEIDDRASNGCYYVGASYKAKGEVEKAIYYFRLSYWSPSWEIANQLEAELSLQNP